jgi:hypothetical protein
MILLSGKVGYRRHLGPAEGNLGRATFVFGTATFETALHLQVT